MADYGSLPFAEQITYFKDKLHLPSEHWDDILGGAHDRAFIVAGAQSADLLADLHAAVLKGIEDGTTLEEFRRDFDKIVGKHGWSGWTGQGTEQGVAWRTRVIYETNLRTSYAAGRWAQIQQVKADRPYLEYRHNDSVLYPRPLHQSWDGLVLSADDPWWRTHYPPNGWGCKCRVFALSEADLAKLGKTQPVTAPDDGIYVKKDRNGTPHTLPQGVDYGWAHAPGAGVEERHLADEAMEQWRAAKADAWETLTPGDWASRGRPERLPADPSDTPLGARAGTAEETVAAVRAMLGADARTLRLQVGGMDLPVHVDAEALGGHIDPARSPYVPLIPETIADPYEVWVMAQRHKGTGKVELRTRILKRIDTGEKGGMILVAQASRGRLEAWTFIPTDDWRYVNKQRAGVLVYGR